MKASLLLFSIIVMNFFGLSAQSIVLSGIVTDQEKEEPLPYVIVMLKTDGGKSILQYARTDEKGTFSIKTSTTQNRFLTFSLMGYESISIPLVEGKKNYRVSLKPKLVQIKEVVVKAPKIRTKGDTIPLSIMWLDMQIVRTKP